MCYNIFIHFYNKIFVEIYSLDSRSPSKWLGAKYIDIAINYSDYYSYLIWFIVLDKPFYKWTFSFIFTQWPKGFQFKKKINNLLLLNTFFNKCTVKHFILKTGKYCKTNEGCCEFKL